MKRMLKLFLLTALTTPLTGCLTPIKNEIPLAGGDLSLRATTPNETKLVIFNDSNVLLFGIDGTGRINVSLDDKGVAQLNIGRFAQVVTSKGRHRIDLVHLDLVHFRSHHSIELSDSNSFVRIFATPGGNEAELVFGVPQDFEKKFKPVHLSK